MKDKKTEKIWFLQIMRATACLLIMYVHWITFILAPNVLSINIHQNILPNYPYLPTANSIMRFPLVVIPESFSEAYFALGLFFIISGFVIPLSIGKSPYEFIVRRIFRIYPILIVGLILICLMIGIARVLDGSSFIYFSLKDTLANLLLVRDILKSPFIENSTWTLEIEWHFYIICFGLAFFNGHQRALALLAIAASFIVLIKSNLLSPNQFTHIIGQGGFLIFTLVGTCLYNWRYGTWSGKKTIVVVLILMAISKYCLIASNQASNPNSIYTNHFFVLLAFLLLMSLNDYLPFSKIFDTVANISYPLYLLHGFFGYSIYYIVYKHTANVYLSLMSVIICVFSLTLLLHKYIEKPAMRFSKNLIESRREARRKSALLLTDSNELIKEGISQ